jgi:hypothetical protein
VPKSSAELLPPGITLRKVREMKRHNQSPKKEPV